MNGKEIGGRKMSRWKVGRHSEKRPFFCHFIFLPFSWLPPKAALGVSHFSWFIPRIMPTDRAAMRARNQNP